VTAGLFGTPLAAAAYLGYEECVKILLEKGAEPNTIIGNGRYSNALHAAHVQISWEDMKPLWWINSYNNNRKWIVAGKAAAAKILARYGESTEGE
jgi:hypothetical protein